MSSSCTNVQTDCSQTPPAARPLIIRVEPGTGGTFVVGHSTGGHPLGDVKFIGVEQCLEELGVYFEIGSNRCFCARIAFVPWFLAGQRVDDAEGDILHDHVVNRLRTEAATKGWQVKDVELNTLVMICPHADKTRVDNSAPLIAAAAIANFLNVDQVNVTTTSHGFIREPGSTPPISGKLSWDRNKKATAQTMAGAGYEPKEHVNLDKLDWEYEHPWGWVSKLKNEVLQRSLRKQTVQVLE